MESTIAKTKKYWIVFAVTYLAGVFFSGSISNDIAAQAGYIGFFSLLTGFVIYRAKEKSSVRIGHFLHIGLVTYFSWSAYDTARQEFLSNYVEGCANRNEYVIALPFSEREKQQKCSCAGKELISKLIFWNYVLSYITTDNPDNIMQSAEFSGSVAEIWVSCGIINLKADT
jgi:hypothetical protein